MSVVPGKVGWQEQQSGHTASAVRKQRAVGAGTQFSLAFGPAVMVDFPICRKVSLGAKDAIDATAHGQSESKAERQHLLALNRAPLRLGSKRTEQEMCWISVLEGTVVLKNEGTGGKGPLSWPIEF